MIINLPPEVQVEVIRRIANMGSVKPEYIQEAERIMEKRLSSMGLSDKMGGRRHRFRRQHHQFHRTGRTEKFILETLDVSDSELAEDIRKCLFVFEDIVKLSNQAIQRVLKEVETADVTVRAQGYRARKSGTRS